MSRRTLCLRQELFGNKKFCMKTRLNSILKTANAMMIIKAFFESPDKVPQML